MKRVLVVGAGFNKNFEQYNVDIPLLNEILMKKFLKKNIECYPNLYKFLLEYCNYKKETIESDSVDVEEIFTLLHQKINSETRNFEEFNSLNSAYKELKSIIKYHYSFNATLEKIESQKQISYWKFIKHLKDNKIDIITFNYDNIIEESILIESFRGLPNKVDRKNWNGPLYYFNNTKTYLNYNFEFLNVEQFDKEDSEYLVPLKFYKNQNYMIKIHGSFDWHLITDFKVVHGEIDEQNQKVTKNPKIEKDENPPDFVGKIIYNFFEGVKPLKGTEFIPWNNYKGYLVRELIVLPELHNCELNLDFFKNNLKTAENILLDCEELIIIGYSFPNTDFHIKKLFLDIFSKHKLKSLIIINPDKTVREKTLKYTHFNRKEKYFCCLSSYIQNLEYKKVE